MEDDTVQRASVNQLRLVAVKLEILEDEINELYFALEKYCSQVIQLGSDSIKEVAKQEQTIMDFYSSFDKAVKLLQEKTREMEIKTKTTTLSNYVWDHSYAGSQLFKVTMSLKSLGESQKQLQDLIRIYRDQMMELGHNFLSSQKNNFSDVSLALEASFVFIMKLRSTFREDKTSDTHLLMYRFYPSHSTQSFTQDVQSSKLLKKVQKLSVDVETNKAVFDVLSYNLSSALREIRYLKARADEAEDDNRDEADGEKTPEMEHEVSLMKSSMALMEDDIEELKLRFESFLRAASSKRENFRTLNNEAKVSDAEMKGQPSEQAATKSRADIDITKQAIKTYSAESVLISADELHPVIAVKDNNDNKSYYEEKET